MVLSREDEEVSISEEACNYDGYSEPDDETAFRAEFQLYREASHGVFLAISPSRVIPHRSQTTRAHPFLIVESRVALPIARF